MNKISPLLILVILIVSLVSSAEVALADEQSGITDLRPGEPVRITDLRPGDVVDGKTVKNVAFDEFDGWVVTYEGAAYDGSPIRDVFGGAPRTTVTVTARRPEQDTTPPPSPEQSPATPSGTQINDIESTLSDAEKALVAATPNRAELVTYVGTDGKLHVATNIQVLANRDNGIVISNNVPVPAGQTAPPSGTLLPPYIADDILANPATATLSTTSTPGERNQYSVSTFREDTSTLGIDYKREVTTTYEEIPPAEGSQLPSSYIAHTTVVNSKNDALSLGYRETSRTQTFVERERVGDSYVTRRGGTEITRGGNTVQLVTNYVTKAEMLTALQSDLNRARTAEDRTRINANIAKVNELPANEPLPEPDIIIEVDGRSVGVLTSDDELQRANADDPPVRDAIIAALGGSNDANEEAADEIINQAHADRARRYGKNWADNYRRQPGEDWWDQGVRIFGSVLRTYDQFAGLGRISTLFMGDFVEKNRETLAKSFCGFAGLQTCLVSSICGQIHEITSSNVLVGTDSTQQKINSASLNAERSEAVLLQGLTQQELIDILGNTSSIGGRFVDLTDPDFKPELLGELRLRLYHVEYSISNRLRDEKLRYNVEFRRLAAPIIIASTQPNRSATADEYTGDYTRYLARSRNVNNQETVSTVSWFPERKTLDEGKTDHEHLQKYSTNEYDAACLVFNPALPSGKSSSSQTVKEFCVPFTEYEGGATQIEATGNITQTTTTTTQPSRQTTTPSQTGIPGSQV